MRLFFAALIVALGIAPTASGQNGEVSPTLVICGGGSLPDIVFQRFHNLAGPRPSLVVIPTASERDFDTEEVQKLWRSRGFQDVCILHSNDRDVASSSEFAAPLKTATSIWFGGGSQQRIVVGRSFVLRLESVEGTIKVDAFSHGDEVPLADR